MANAPSLLFLKLVFNRLPERVPWAMRAVARMISAGADKTLLGPQISNHFAFLESELHNREWFAGNDLTAADVQMSFPIEAADARVGFAGKFPRLKAFVDRIHARPAYKRAIERGGPQTFFK